MEQGDEASNHDLLVSHSPCLPVLPPRPLLLYPEPQAMEVVCVAPDGPPQFVWVEERRERIVELRGAGADRNVVVARAVGAARLLSRGHRVGQPLVDVPAARGRAVVCAWNLCV